MRASARCWGSSSSSSPVRTSATTTATTSIISQPCTNLNEGVNDDEFEDDIGCDQGAASLGNHRQHARNGLALGRERGCHRGLGLTQAHTHVCSLEQGRRARRCSGSEAVATRRVGMDAAWAASRSASHNTLVLYLCSAAKSGNNPGTLAVSLLKEAGVPPACTLRAPTSLAPSPQNPT